VKVAISFIGTGNYLNFLPKWYEYVENNFLPGVEKKILVFTDGELEDTPDNMSVYFIEHKEWPYITLERFQTLLLAKEEIEKYDWFVFLDADTLVVDKVSEEEFFDENKKYFGVHHPCHYLNMPPHNKYPGAFEVDKKSLACVDESDDLSVYYQGCVWGGRVPDVIEMINNLDNNVRDDLEKNVIAKWHDESHINHFFAKNKEDVNTLHSSYAYPHDFKEYCTFEPKIVHSKNFSSY
jgi:hypothetical protein